MLARSPLRIVTAVMRPRVMVGRAPPQKEAVCWAVLSVTWVAAPAPLVTMPVTGWARPKFWQLRLSNDPASRLARKVYRVSPTVGTGEGQAANRRSLAARNGVWMLIRFWQNICGLLL